MILEAYHQRLLGQISDGGPGGASVYVAWAVINGSGVLTKFESSNRSVPADGSTSEVMAYDPGTDILTDPNKMRKVTSIMVYNSRLTTLAIQFYVQKMDGAPSGYSGTYRLTPSFVIPASGMMSYTPETGWRIHDATGRVINGANSYFP